MLRILNQSKLEIVHISAKEFINLCNETQPNARSMIRYQKAIHKFYKSAPETAIWLGVPHDDLKLSKGACSYRTDDFHEYSSRTSEAKNVFLIIGIQSTHNGNYVMFYPEPRNTVQSALRAFRITQLTF